jgi:hypothetical protein
MEPGCRTAESACAKHKFKGTPGSYTVRSQLISYMPIQIGWRRTMAVGPESDVENEVRITKINTRLQVLFGAQLEILFGKLTENVITLWFSAT